MANVLVGRKLLAVYLNPTKQAIRFETAEGDVVAQCYADCCSHTWIESVSLPGLGLPALVVSVENLDGLQDGKWDEGAYELTQFYGLKIITDRGELLLDYRNASNGYYGGSLEWPDASFYGGVYGQQKVEGEWGRVE